MKRKKGIPGEDVLQSESSCPFFVAETKQRLERLSRATWPPSQTGLNSCGNGKVSVQASE
jgi:hypothetical protein